jgi:ribonucleoside-diphosphate reductase alpha chain
LAASPTPFGRWGLRNGYFASPEDAQAFRDELVYLLLHQYGSFNSPVWFNIGVSGAKQQASACFINSVHDNMESIMELAATEARLFQRRLGAGSNLSRIRSSKEHLSGGGIASGPVSFMRGWDAFAGAIKSGGTTRRAAKMVILDAQHPDIEEFILCKATEEKKAWALIDAGYNGGFNVPGGAYDSVDFQNANHSVRVTDEFMRAAENGMEWSTRSVTDRLALRQAQAPRTCCAKSPKRRTSAATPACNTTPPSTTGTPLPIRTASMPATRARSSSSSTTPPATWPA